ncbi:sulfatase-like hydrolase/transferase, partial [candidate division KSB1 bacterium]|nr:sulfatase-like hydrolase/transferase [candidate division KSB1 bacterium]
MITSAKTSLFILCITLILHVGCQEKKEGNTSHTSKPNILIIQMNDLGYEEIAFYPKNGIALTNLDRLGRESVRFQRFYVAALGAPTQASLLTGRHYLRTGVSHNNGGRNFVSLQEKTIAKFFKESGYTTGMWGLWQLGDSPGYYPWHRGFDDAFIIRQKLNGKGAFYNGESIENTSVTDEVITDYALRFIENASNRPFFAYIAYVNDPGVVENIPLDIAAEKDIPESVAKRYAAIKHCDTQIGRLLSALNQLHLDDNTTVIFMSNNGPAMNDPLLSRQNTRPSARKHLKGTKGTLAENGIRSPFYIRYKNVFTSEKNQVLADVSDLFPTLCDIAGISTAENNVLLDGKTLTPVLKKQSSRRDDKLVFNYAEPSWQFTHDSTRLLQTYEPVLQSDTSALEFSRQTLSVHNQDYKLVLNPLFIDHSIPLVNG